MIKGLGDRLRGDVIPMSLPRKRESRRPSKDWIPAFAGMTHYESKGLFHKSDGSLTSIFERLRNPQSAIRSVEKGFTLIEIIVVIVILCIVSGITIKFLVDSLRIYTMTVNQKTLFDEGKLALERMCRDIRDARSITGTTATSITFTRNDATAQDGAGENIRFDLSGSTLRKVKNAGGAPENPIAMADNVSTFIVTNATNEIQLQLTLSRTSGENVTLRTKVYPKNLSEDLGSPPTYRNFRIQDSGGNFASWQEVQSP